MPRNYNIHANVAHTVYDNDRYKYEVNYDNIYSPNKDYQANYSGLMVDDAAMPSPYNPNSNCPQSPDMHYASGAASDVEYSDNQLMSQMIPQSNLYLYDKSAKAPYMGSKSELPYMSRDRLANTMCTPSPRETHYGLKSPGMYSGGESVHSVHSMLKNDYQVQSNTIAISSTDSYQYQNS